MKITIFGTGYVGLVTGLGFAKLNHDVTCVDIIEEKINNLKQGKLPIYERGLKELLEYAQSEGKITFTTNAKEAIESAEIIFLTLPTPPAKDGSANLSAIEAVAKQIGQFVNADNKIIISKSTVPVGTCANIEKWTTSAMKEKNANYKIHFVSNPEFLAEGSAVEDFERPSRIVIGTNSEYAKEQMQHLYRPFMLNNHPIFIMDPQSSELSKYAANGMLAVRISVMNEIARLCDKCGADINKIRQSIAADPRIGSKFLYAGCGYGGSCFPKDTRALVSTANQYGTEMSIVHAANEANEKQKQYLIPKIEEFHGNLSSQTFAVWGLAFKKDTDDIRESPAIALIEKLLEKGAKIQVFDPMATENARKIFGDKISYAEKKYDALHNAASLIVMSDWDTFKQPDFAEIKSLNIKAIFDGKNLYIPEEVKKAGLQYHGIGRR